MRCYRLTGSNILVLLVIICSIFSAIPAEAAAQTAFTVSQYDVELVLRPDGSCVVTETVCFDFQTETDRITLNIPYTDNLSLTIDQIAISETTPGQDAAVLIEILPDEPGDNQQKPLTYRLSDKGQFVELSIIALAEAASSRQLRLSYQLDPLIRRHFDTAILDHPFFAGAGAVDRENLELSVRLEGITSVDQIRFWAVPVSQQIFARDMSRSDAFVYQADQLPASQPQMTLVALFDLFLFPGAPDAAQPLGWDQAVELAGTRAENASQARPEQNVSSQLLVALLLMAAAAFFIFLYWRFDHESSPEYHQKISRNIPDELPPAVLVQLLRRKRYARLLLATLFDLVRRGVLRREGYIFIRDTDAPQLSGLTRAYEIYLISWLFDHVAVSDRISISSLRAYARQPEMSADFRAYFQQFIMLTEEALPDEYLVDERRSKAGRWIARTLAGVYTLLTLGIVLYLNSPDGYWLLIPAAGFLIYGFLLRRLTRSGCELYARTQAIRRAIRHPWRLSPSPDLSFCARALPAAVAIGSEKHLFKYMSTMSERIEQDPGFSDWNQLSMMSESSSWQDGLNRLQEDLQVMESLISVSILLTGSLPI